MLETSSVIHLKTGIMSKKTQHSTDSSHAPAPTETKHRNMLMHDSLGAGEYVTYSINIQTEIKTE